MTIPRRSFLAGLAASVLGLLPWRGAKAVLPAPVELPKPPPGKLAIVVSDAIGERGPHAFCSEATFAVYADHRRVEAIGDVQGFAYSPNGRHLAPGTVVELHRVNDRWEATPWVPQKVRGLS